MTSSFTDRFYAERAALEEEVRREDFEELGDVQADALMWAAVAPAWTEPLAQAAGFPSTSAASQVLDRMTALGWLRRRPATPVARERGAVDVYTMPEGRRAEILSEVARDPKRGRDALRGAIVAAARAIQRSPASLVPEDLARWAELGAQVEDPAAVETQLEWRTRSALERGEIGQALAWIGVARVLESVLGEELSGGVSLAGRLVELHQRVVDDKRRLVGYVEQPEAVAMFDELLRAPDHVWALHLVGMAGVGKTMLLRHISARVAPQRGLAVARVDFDHLDPNYPARSPGLLLDVLAQELRAWDERQAASKGFQRTGEDLLGAQERYDGRAERWREAGAAELERAERRFAESLSALSRRAVLLFDTCEELARVGPPGANVTAALALLERLHRRVPSLRVVLSGRRPLARAGAGWTATGHDDLPERPYLMLREMRGFTPEQAVAFLTARSVPGHLHDAILNRSCEMARIRGLAPAGALSTAIWYLPFQLALYARWAETDPDLTAAIVATTEPEEYVAMRLVGRLRAAEAGPLLAATAVLREASRAALRATWDGDDASFERGFRALADHEWVERLAADRLALPPRLAREIEHHFAREQPAALARARVRALAHLETATLQGPLAELDAGDFVTLLVALEAEPMRLGAWWREAEARLARDGLDWLARVVSRRLADEEAPLLPWARGALLAAHAAVELHASPDAIALLSRWREVAKLCRSHPDARERDRLARRARAGIVAWTPGTDRPETLDEVWRDLARAAPRELDDQLAAAYVAAAQAAVEAGWVVRSRDGRVEAAPVENLAAALERSAPELRATAAWVAAHACFCEGRSADAVGWLRAAREACPVGTTRQAWLDWCAPEDVGARVRIAAARQTPDDADRVRLRAEDVSAVGETPDGYALVAAALQTSGAVSVAAYEEVRRAVPPAMLARTASVPVGKQGFRMATPRLVALLERVRAGDGEAWFELSRTRATHESVGDAVGAREAEVTVVRAARWLRQPEFPSLALRSDAFVEDLSECLALLALTGPVRAPGDLPPWPSLASRMEDPELKHALWATSAAVRPGHARALVDWAADALDLGRADAADPIANAALQLDRLEANELAAGARPFRPGAPTIPNGAALGTPDSAAQWLRVAIRADALTSTIVPLPWADSGSLAPLVARVGVRRAARLALKEAELLALRLPIRALRPAIRALTWFDRAEDRIGTFVAAGVLGLSAARAVDRKWVAPLERQLETTYDRHRGALGLPPWDALSAGLEAIPALVAGPWGRWAERLVAIRAWLRGDGAVLATVRASPAGEAAELSFTEQRRAPAPSAAAQPPAAYDSVSIRRVEPSRTRLGMPYVVRFTQVTSAAVSTAPETAVILPDDDRAYADLAAALSRTVPLEGVPVNGRLELRVEIDASAPPWEALFEALARNGAPMPLWRSVASARGAGRPRREIATVTVIGETHVHQELAAKVWHQKPGLSLRYARSLREARVLDTDAVHLAGTPVSTASGVRLQLGGSYEQQTRSAGLELLSSGDVARLAPSATACVLQAVTPFAAQRTSTDRAQASALRAFGAELQASGIRTVVVAPPLPFGAAVDFLAPIAAELLASAEHERLPDVVREGRKALAAAFGPEVAADACLYDRDAG